MITIIPTLEIMKAMTDNNIKGEGAKVRVDAFNSAVELQSMTDIKIVIEGILFDRISQRMNEDQIKAYRETNSIDESAVNLDYDFVRAIKWIAENKYAKLGKVIIITETSNFSLYNLANPNVINISPKDFIEKYDKLMDKLAEFRKLLPEEEFTEILIHKLAQRIFCH